MSPFVALLLTLDIHQLVYNYSTMYATFIKFTTIHVLIISCRQDHQVTNGVIIPPNIIICDFEYWIKLVSMCVSSCSLNISTSTCVSRISLLNFSRSIIKSMNILDRVCTMCWLDTIRSAFLPSIMCFWCNVYHKRGH